MENLRQQAQQEQLIIDHYIAKEDTRLIIPALHMDYESVVLEKDTIYCVRQKPLDIIKATCEDDWTTYESRKKIIAKRLNMPHKTPIIVSQKNKLFAYPTLSPNHYQCSWVFVHLSVLVTKEGKQGVLIIHDRTKVKLDVSPYILQAQSEKALELQHAVIGVEKSLYRESR